jgi:3-hydroxyisobutyrate dehydrogenase-like beta-hydroxyacid dehydrogenase
MTVQTVAILSPGDMGHVVGQVLNEHGLRVITCLRGRSERTRALAARAHIEDVPDYQTLTEEADMLLSIMVPAQALYAARAVARALAETGADLLYVDCNAIAPQTAREIEDVITQARARFVDGSIIGGPPRKPGTTRFYASGAHASQFAALGEYGLDVIVLEGPAGQASALKMCYGALTKGLSAISIELLTAAKALGISEPLRQEFQQSQAPLYARMERGLPHVPERSARWVGEMEQIAQTFEHLGLTPRTYLGAADIYRLVAGTKLAERNPEDADPAPTLEELQSTLARHLPGFPRGSDGAGD